MWGLCPCGPGGGGGGCREVLEGVGGGEGSWIQTFVYQKWPDQIFPTVSFVFSHNGHPSPGGYPPPPPSSDGVRPFQYFPGPLTGQTAFHRCTSWYVYAAMAGSPSLRHPYTSLAVTPCSWTCFSVNTWCLHVASQLRHSRVGQISCCAVPSRADTDGSGARSVPLLPEEE